MSTVIVCIGGCGQTRAAGVPVCRDCFEKRLAAYVAQRKSKCSDCDTIIRGPYPLCAPCHDKRTAEYLFAAMAFGDDTTTEDALAFLVVLVAGDVPESRQEHVDDEDEGDDDDAVIAEAQ